MRHWQVERGQLVFLLQFALVLPLKRVSGPCAIEFMMATWHPRHLQVNVEFQIPFFLLVKEHDKIRVSGLSLSDQRIQSDLWDSKQCGKCGHRRLTMNWI